MDHYSYTSLQLTPDAVTGQFHFLRTVRERDSSLTETVGLHVQHGARRLEPI